MKFMKKVFLAVLTIAVVSCLFVLYGVTSYAETITGTYGALSYSITDGEVTITACDKNATEVEIPETIEGYPIIKIGNKAFFGCSKLTQLTINARNFTVGSNVFWGCGSATDGMTVVFGDSVEQIPDRIMSSNEDSPIQTVNIKNLSIGENVKVIGDNAFSECINLASIAMSDSVEIIGDGAFFCCYALTEVDIPSRVSTIGNSAFYSCNNLESVTIGDSVETIGDNAFYCCYALTEVDIPSRVSTIGNSAFCSCNNLESVTIGDSAETIGNNAFYGCSALSEITIPDSVESIGNRAFYGCFSLTEIIIPDSVTSIGNEAFYGCADLSSVTIGNTVETIGYRAFYNCTGLTKINWNAKNVRSFSSEPDVFFCAGYESEGIEVVFGENVESIPTGCFAGYADSGMKSANIKKVIIGESVTMIGDYAFWECKGLESITIPDSLVSIGYSAFMGCANLTNVIISNSINTIGARTFYNCTSLKNISIPESVEYIATDAFYGSGLEKIVINNPKCVIEYNASAIPSDAVIYGYANSPAQMYAQMYGRDFVALAEGECDHTYSEWIVDADATCSDRGFMHRVCTLCNGYEFDVIEKTGHIDNDADNICDVCDEVLSSQTPDIDDGGESGDNNSSDGISSFLQSIKELFNSIISWLRTLFGIA